MPKNKETLINFSDSIFVAGAKGMVGSSITRLLIKKGYGDKSKGGDLLTPSRKELNLCDYSDVQMWFKKNCKPSLTGACCGFERSWRTFINARAMSERKPITSWMAVSSLCQ
mgnify:CR=1 FL=1